MSENRLTKVEVRVPSGKFGGHCSWLGALRELERDRSWRWIDGIEVMGVNERIYVQSLAARSVHLELTPLTNLHSWVTVEFNNTWIRLLGYGFSAQVFGRGHGGRIDAGQVVRIYWAV